MDRDALIREITAIVEAACAAETNMFGYGIWTHHISQVARNGVRLAGLFGADAEIVEIAALLHDYASVKDEALYKEHHIHSQTEAEKILKSFDYPVERIEAVKECIASHRGSVRRERKSPEAECLANADGLTHIEQIPSFMHLAYVQFGMEIDEGAGWVRSKLNRTWNKLDPQVQEMIAEKFVAALLMLTVASDATSQPTLFDDS
jgi:uncharacterized protein